MGLHMKLLQRQLVGSCLDTSVTLTELFHKNVGFNLFYLVKTALDALIAVTELQLKAVYGKKKSSNRMNNG